MSEATIAHPGEPCDPPCEVELARARPRYSENEMDENIAQRTAALNRSYREIITGRSHIAIHNVLCGCVSADCTVRYRVKFLVQPAGMADFFHMMLNPQLIPGDVLDRVFADLSPAECDRMRKFLVRAENA